MTNDARTRLGPERVTADRDGVARPAVAMLADLSGVLARVALWGVAASVAASVLALVAG